MFDVGYRMFIIDGMAEPDDPESLPTQPWAGGDEAPTIPATPPPARDPSRSVNSRRGGWQPPTPEEMQPSFPQYEIRCVIGRGGMGAVYQGWQKSLRRFVAIKILPPQFEVNDDANFIQRFQREAQALARFAHPGIVSVYDAGETPEGLLYFVMEYVEGTDVQKMLTSQGRLSPEHALAITAHVCDALAYAHRRGVIHRDIKPSNIMVDSEGQVKVADFGLAKVSSDDSAALLTGTHVRMGTPDFMAPESMWGLANVDHRADLYAVGVMLYQMLTGQLPRGRFDPPSHRIPGLDARFDAIVDHALQTDPDKRYSSAIEIRSDLDRILTEPAASKNSPLPPAQHQPAAMVGLTPGEPPTKPLTVEEAPSQPRPRVAAINRVLLYAGIALGVAALLVVIAWAFVDRARPEVPLATVAPSHSLPPIAKKATTPEPANHFEELVQLGKQLRDRGDMSSAITKFREAAAVDAKNPLALNELASTYDKMGLADKAAENWGKIYEMGDAAGIYYQVAEAKLKASQAYALRDVRKATPAPDTPVDNSAAIDGIAAGATLGLLQVTSEEQHDEGSAKHFTLHIPIKARPKAHIDVKDIVLHILFYDIVDGQNVVQTSANVNFRWVTPPADWVDSDTEELTGEYQLPKPKGQAAKRENRKYFGYIVRIYYKQQLQAATAQPERLAQQYPAPPTLPKGDEKQGPSSSGSLSPAGDGPAYVGSTDFEKRAWRLRESAITHMEQHVIAPTEPVATPRDLSQILPAPKSRAAPP